MKRIAPPPTGGRNREKYPLNFLKIILDRLLNQKIYTFFFFFLQILGIVGFVAQRVSSYFQSSFSPISNTYGEL